MPKVTLIITIVYSLMKELLNSEMISSLHQSSVFLLYFTLAEISNAGAHLEPK